MARAGDPGSCRPVRGLVGAGVEGGALAGRSGPENLTGADGQQLLGNDLHVATRKVEVCKTMAALTL